jgi:hypothetical protein
MVTVGTGQRPCPHFQLSLKWQTIVLLPLDNLLIHLSSSLVQYHAGGDVSYSRYDGIW